MHSIVKVFFLNSFSQFVLPYFSFLLELDEFWFSHCIRRMDSNPVLLIHKSHSSGKNIMEIVTKKKRFKMRSESPFKVIRQQQQTDSQWNRQFYITHYFLHCKIISTKPKKKTKMYNGNGHATIKRSKNIQ